MARRALLPACGVDLFVRLGRRARAEEQLAQVERCARLGKSNVAPCLAWPHAALGNRDEAFAWVERGIEVHDAFVPSLAGFRRWDPLRGDPRYDAILDRLAFPAWSGVRWS